MCVKKKKLSETQSLKLWYKTKTKLVDKWYFETREVLNKEYMSHCNSICILNNWNKDESIKMKKEWYEENKIEFNIKYKNEHDFDITTNQYDLIMPLWYKDNVQQFFIKFGIDYNELKHIDEFYTLNKVNEWFVLKDANIKSLYYEKKKKLIDHYKDEIIKLKKIYESALLK